MQGGYEVQIEHKGPSNTVAALLAVAAIVLSVAAVAIANWLGLALLAVGIGAGAVGVGIGIRNTFYGLAMIIRQKGEADAARLRAEREVGYLEQPQQPRLMDGR